MVNAPYVSFVIPVRGREEHRKGLFVNILEVYGDIDYEIILADQADTRLFKRGQLCNLGFKKSRGEVIVFQDIDVRHLRPIDFTASLKEFKKPFLGFSKITQLKELEPGEYEEIETKNRRWGYGACEIFTRDQFKKSYGFSNLIVGWGAEDDIMNHRVGGFPRLGQNLGHVQHKADSGQRSRVSENLTLFRSEKTRDPEGDSYLHTEATEEYHTIIDQEGKIHLYGFADITPGDGFKYRELLNDNL